MMRLVDFYLGLGQIDPRAHLVCVEHRELLLVQERNTTVFVFLEAVIRFLSRGKILNLLQLLNDDFIGQFLLRIEELGDGTTNPSSGEHKDDGDDDRQNDCCFQAHLE